MIPAELHAHIFMDGKDYKNSVARFKDGIDKKAVRAALSAYQKCGITFVRDGGDPFGACLYAKSIASLYNITYLAPAFALFKKGNYGKVAGVPYTDLAEYKALVLKAKSKGADFIKIMVSGILDFNRFGKVSETEYQPEFVKELVHIAHAEGLAVMAHASGTENVRSAALAGADSIEHGYYMDHETMEILAEKKLLWVPTAVTSTNLIGTGRFDDCEVKKIAEAHKQAVSDAAARGVLIGCGSDAGAFAVHHASGCLEEYALLKNTIGARADDILQKAEQLVRNRFSR